jgi:putative ATPase
MKNTLFEDKFLKERNNLPLSARIVPTSLSEFVGQEHILSSEKLLHQNLIKGDFSSCILWGPPGCGKSSLANVIKETLKWDFFSFSATTTSIKEVKKAMESAKLRSSQNKKTIIFIDEIHRFIKNNRIFFCHILKKDILS